MFSDHTISIEKLNNAGVRIPQATTVHVAVECPPEGLTINACGRTGFTILYISTTHSPNGALYEEIIRIKSGRCRNKYIPCPARRRRQTDSQSDRIYITIKGVEEENEYDLIAMPDDFSTPQGILYNTLVLCVYSAVLYRYYCDKATSTICQSLSNIIYHGPCVRV